MSIPPNSKEISKQLEFVKQQQQLRAIDMSSQSKQLSAESMIADLVYKKDIFQKRTPETLQKQELTGWISDWAVPPLYERVWLGVQGHSASGLTDTPSLSALLLTSGLPTDTLGYIWSLANHTVPGALTQHELYMVLALVALAQTGYVINNITTLHQLPQAPVPKLDLSQLPTQLSTPTTMPSSYPSLLSVSSLPDPPATSQNYSWAPPTQSSTDQIGISYVSSTPRPVISLSDKPVHNTGHGSNTSSTLLANVNDTKKNNSQKYLNNYSFSFPKLSESPSHVVEATFPSDSDPIDDEFTEFQSADFSPSTQLKAKILKANSSSVVTDEDEFSTFQTALPNYNNDDLSVLVVDGKNISTQQLWVADNSCLTEHPDEMSGQIESEMKTNYISRVKFENNSFIEFDTTKNINSHSANKYDVFQEIPDDTLSVFHNPLSDDEDKLSIASGNAVDGITETKSIFHNSLFKDTDTSSDSFKLRNLPPQVPDRLKFDKNSDVDGLKSKSEEDEDFDNFQTFPVNFPDNEPSHSTDKYNVFRTIVFNETTDLSTKQVTSNKGEDEIWNNEQFIQDEKDLFSKKENTFFNKLPAQETDNSKINKLQESLKIKQNENSNLNNLFYSLEISDKNNEMDNNTELGEGEDKYKALRLLEFDANETDEFGDFFGAELPNTESDPQGSEEQPSIQIRCLEACLNLLKTGLAILSKASSQEVVSEILGDSRGNTYLDCLLEVHRVSERIIAHLNYDLPLTAELRQTWHAIEPYFTQSNHNPLAETVGAMCGVCRSNTGPSSVTFGSLSFHAPCANLYLHCVEPVLPNSNSGVCIQ